MRVWLVAVILLLLGVVILRPVFFPRPESLGGNRFPWITASVVFMLALVLDWFEWRWQAVQHEATNALKLLTGRGDAEVECQRAGAQLLFLGSESGRVDWVEGDERAAGHVAWLDTTHAATWVTGFDPTRPRRHSIK